MFPRKKVFGSVSLSMMRRVYSNECSRREIKPDSDQGGELASVILQAFLGGLTDECELTSLVRNHRLAQERASHVAV
ncbi:hypothetical protein GGD55_002361 [Rhizobium giardinii]|uniref:Uncharacterized protein n=1 Tax=Rhizobium giardinii TaxID=56731 RepID=A0A7W8UA93_9HYPH|nr:hypothetical protein [Rhizobium giardinii]